MIDDEGHEFDISITVDISCNEFNTLLKNSIAFSSGNYDLNNYNCTYYALEMANLIGLIYPIRHHHGYLILKLMVIQEIQEILGEDIKLLNIGSKNSSGGNSPPTNCN